MTEEPDRTRGGHVDTDADRRNDSAPIRRKPGWAARLLAESTLIAFSVFFALAADEWRDRRNEQARATIALEAIASEVATNRDAAERTMKFHRAAVEKLKAAAATGGPLSEELAYSGQLFQPAALMDVAWIAARESGATVHWPHDLMLEIWLLYEKQSKYTTLASQLGADIYSDIRRRGAEEVLLKGYMGLATLAADFSGREGSLVRDYDRVLPRVHARLGHSPAANQSPAANRSAESPLPK